MDLSIEEFNALADGSSLLKMRIADLERSAQEKDELLKRKDEQILKLIEENARLASQSTSLNLQNHYLRNIIYLSAERVKEFSLHVKDMAFFSLLHTFLEWATPEKYRNEQLAVLHEVLPLPEDNPQVVFKNPKFEGPMFDVHDNDEVKLNK